MARINICLNCGIKFIRKHDPNRIYKFCSQRCFSSKRWQNEEYRKEMSEKHKGQIKVNKGKHIQLNTGRTHFKKGEVSIFKGKHHTEESNLKNKLKHLGMMTGERHWNWRGGITPESHELRNTPAYKEWRKTVYKRDYWTYQICGQKGGNIRANHIKKFADCPELRFEISNGIVICRECALFWVVRREKDWESYFNFNLETRGCK